MLSTILVSAFAALLVLEQLFFAIYDKKLSKKKKLKNGIKVGVAIISISGIVVGILQKIEEDKEHEKEISIQHINDSLEHRNMAILQDSLNNINSALNVQIKQNDSLKVSNKTIVKQNDKILDRTFAIEKKEDEHFEGIQKGFDGVSSNVGFRQFNNYTENKLIEVFRKNKLKIAIQVNSPTNEALTFQKQLKRIFQTANCEVLTSPPSTNNIYFNGLPDEGMLIVLDTSNSKVIEPINTILDAMQSSNYKCNWVHSKNSPLGINATSTPNGTPKFNFSKNDIDIFIQPFTKK